MSHHRINLRDTNSIAGPFPITNGIARCSATIYSSVGTTYVVTMQHSLSIDRDVFGTDMTQWIAFTPTRTLTSTSTSLLNRPVVGCGNIRFIVTTSEDDADTNARLVVLLEP
jgi:hypothetical protein